MTFSPKEDGGSQFCDQGEGAGFPPSGGIRNFAEGDWWWSLVVGESTGGIFLDGGMSKVSDDEGDSPHPPSRENPGRVCIVTDFS